MCKTKTNWQRLDLNQYRVISFVEHRVAKRHVR
jgi:hypothetical protein